MQLGKDILNHMEKNKDDILLLEIRERLASNCHSSWSGWMSYMFEHSRHNKNGSMTIPKHLVERWARQMKTGFEELGRKEQESDYVEADRIMNLLKACLLNEKR